MFADQGPSLAPQAIQHLPETSLGNPVTAVLIAYRAFDTMLEKVVLVLAVASDSSLGDYGQLVKDVAGRAQSAAAEVTITGYPWDRLLSLQCGTTTLLLLVMGAISGTSNENNLRTRFGWVRDNSILGSRAPRVTPIT